MSFSGFEHEGTPPAAAITSIFTMPSAYCSSISTPFWDSGCMPPGWSRYWASDYGYYSPAICPSGYESACARPTTTNSGWGPMGPELLPDETAQICCPIGYECSTYQSYCFSMGPATASTAYALQVRWQASDLPDLETNPTVSGQGPPDATTTDSASTSEPTGPITPGPTQTQTDTTSTSDPTSTSSSSSGSGGMSTGAKVGVGVAVPVAAIAIIAGGLLFWWRRKKTTHPTGTTGQPELSEPTHYQHPQQYQPVPPNPQQYHDPSYNPQGITPSMAAAGYKHPSQNMGPPAQLPDYNRVYTEREQRNSPQPPMNNAPMSTYSTGQAVSPQQTHTYAGSGVFEAQGNDSYMGPGTGVAGSHAGSQPDQEMSEVQRLRMEQARLAERRNRLTQLQELDEQERLLSSRLAELETNKP